MWDVDLLPVEGSVGVTKVDSFAREDVEERPVDVAATESSIEARPLGRKQSAVARVIDATAGRPTRTLHHQTDAQPSYCRLPVLKHSTYRVRKNLLAVWLSDVPVDAECHAAAHLLGFAQRRKHHHWQ